MLNANQAKAAYSVSVLRHFLRFARYFITIGSILHAHKIFVLENKMEIKNHHIF